MSRPCLPPRCVLRQPDQSPSAGTAEIVEVLATLGGGAADAGLYGTEPAKRRPGHANFAISEPPLKLVLLQNPVRAAP